MESIEKLKKEIYDKTSCQKEIINKAIENRNGRDYIECHIEGYLTQDTKIWLRSYNISFKENKFFDNKSVITIYF